MTYRFLNLLTASVVAVAAAAGCVHTPPHTSVEVALAKKASLVKMPAPPAAPPAVVAERGSAVEPALPAREATVERVAEAYSRGVFCVQAGQDADAMHAFEDAVKIDPTFTDAWQNLAMLYEKTGQTKKAVEAFRRAKKDGGGMVSALPQPTPVP